MILRHRSMATWQRAMGRKYGKFIFLSAPIMKNDMFHFTGHFTEQYIPRKWPVVKWSVGNYDQLASRTKRHNEEQK